jgi:hypothetical protein
MKRLLLLLALGAAIAACTPSSGSSANPDESGPALESLPAESLPAESMSPAP